MNDKQSDYQRYKFSPKNDTYHISLALLYGAGIHTYPFLPMEHVILGPLMLGVYGFLGYKGFKHLFKSWSPLRERLRYYEIKSKAKINPLPLHSINNITFSYTRGLEELLERTRAEEKLEWGTVLNLKVKGKDAQVKEILDPHYAEFCGFINCRKLTTVQFQLTEIFKEEWNGTHHFHPLPNRGANYYVSYQDKVFGAETINFITFNMPDGPEIIGYNLFNTFLSINKRKTKLVKATHKDIMKYLA